MPTFSESLIRVGPRNGTGLACTAQGQAHGRNLAPDRGLLRLAQGLDPGLLVMSVRMTIIAATAMVRATDTEESTDGRLPSI